MKNLDALGESAITTLKREKRSNNTVNADEYIRKDLDLDVALRRAVYTSLLADYSSSDELTDNIVYKVKKLIQRS